MSRRRRVSRKDRQKQRQLATQIILAALIAIVLGVLLGKLYHQWMLKPGNETASVGPGESGVENREPELTPENPPDPPVEAEEENGTKSTGVTSIAALRLYRVQAAAFEQLENAENLLKQLEEELHIKGYIAVANDFYRVNLGILATGTGAGEFAQRVGETSELLPETPIIITEIMPGREIKHPKQDAGYWNGLQGAINASVNISREMEDLWLAFDAGGKSPGEVIREIENLQQEAESLGERIESLGTISTEQNKPQQHLVKLRDNLHAALEQFRRQVEAGEKDIQITPCLTNLVEIWQEL
jgi:hypothetical protein